ncbi:MAG: deoxyuridine 5'-triphosphate nucleotidohydrolase [Bacteroidia bacterium]|nr:MAG: deoxyuridine 5'-triphosphate nucleotidohydrolase [Bacteroidia bacterium]
MKVRIINTSNNPLPKYQTEGSSGLDVSAFLEKPIEIKPLERVLVPTGLYLEIPSGYEVQIRPRSGLALNYGITLLNSPATIDSDYRGEIKILIINLGQENFMIENGTRIAQLVFSKIEKIQWSEVLEIDSTERNQNGFGHTGNK